MASAVKTARTVEVRPELWDCLSASARQAGVPVQDYVNGLIEDHYVVVGANLPSDSPGSRPVRLTAEGAALLVDLLENPPEPTEGMKELKRRHGSAKTGTGG